MARPTKQGLDYFLVDVQFDDKVELHIAEEGSDGLSVLWKEEEGGNISRQEGSTILWFCIMATL